jgi:hypothetical protein
MEKAAFHKERVMRKLTIRRGRRIRMILRIARSLATNGVEITLRRNGPTWRDRRHPIIEKYDDLSKYWIVRLGFE